MVNKLRARLEILKEPKGPTVLKTEKEKAWSRIVKALSRSRRKALLGKPNVVTRARKADQAVNSWN